MSTKREEKLPVFTLAEFLAYYAHVEKYGMSIYKGVLVVWDLDEDSRVFTFIDKFRSRAALVAVHEHKAGLSLLFTSDKYAEMYPQGKEFWVDGDVWCVDTVAVVSRFTLGRRIVAHLV